MLLECHVNEPGSSFAGCIQDIENDHRAEEVVKEIATDRELTNRPWVIVKFILLDEHGVRCTWERSIEDARQGKLPVVTQWSARYSGKWTSR